jgi:hypothetical protein
MLDTQVTRRQLSAVKKQYYWPGMKKEVVDFIARCLECQKVKVEHRHPTGLLQPFPIPEWKWEVVTMDFITKLPRTAKTIVSDRDSKFTSNFWKGLFKGFGTNLNFSTTYHPESDGKTERVNQVIEDMLRMYVMDKPSKWEDYLHLVEFSYNNGYQASLKMSPFEALYGRKCNTPVSWDNPTDRAVVGPEICSGKWKRRW